MKSLSVLMAMLILVLSCIPCSDAGGFTMERTRVINHTHTEDHSAGKEHTDLCSPFCQCACCSIAFALPLPIIGEVKLKQLITDPSFAICLKQYPEGITLPVWQPPRFL